MNEPDIDLVRLVGFQLEALQRSPPEPIILSFDEFGQRMNAHPDHVAAALAELSRLQLIDGPGLLGQAWLFRQITAKGRAFLDEIRSDQRWDEIKRRYGHARVPTD